MLLESGQPLIVAKVAEGPFTPHGPARVENRSLTSFIAFRGPQVQGSQLRIPSPNTQPAHQHSNNTFSYRSLRPLDRFESQPVSSQEPTKGAEADHFLSVEIRVAICSATFATASLKS
jgi:hypothetical protein